MEIKTTKEFNDTGVCIPERHYMADVSKKMRSAWSLLEKGKYFIISRPRQYGKTTLFYLLTRRMEKDANYLPLKMSFAGMGDLVFETESLFVKKFGRTSKVATKRECSNDVIKGSNRSQQFKRDGYCYYYS